MKRWKISRLLDAYYPVRVKRAQGGRVIGVSVGMFVDTKTSSLSEKRQFMSSTYYVPVSNRKKLASTYLTNESIRLGAKKSRLLNFSALLKLL